MGGEKKPLVMSDLGCADGKWARRTARTAAGGVGARGWLEMGREKKPLVMSDLGCADGKWARRTARTAADGVGGHGICTLSPLDAALPMRFVKNTQHDASKVLRLLGKMTMDTSKVLRWPRKLQRIF